MKFFKKMFGLFLIMSIIFIQFSNAAFAKDYAKANASTKVTENAPQVLLSPGKSIPFTEETAPPNNKTYSFWTLIAVAFASALGSAAGGGASSSGNGGDTGSVSGSW